MIEYDCEFEIEIDVKAIQPPKVQKEESELINSALQVNFKKLL